MDDVASWVLAGLAAGGLAGAAEPGRPRGSALAVLAAGLLGALLGGRLWSGVFGGGPATFLGSAILGVLAALALSSARPGAGGGYDR